MPIVLPERALAPTRLNPKILLLYGIPKVGKTEALTQLENCLILDAEGGSEMYSCLRHAINSSRDIVEVQNAIIEKGVAFSKANPGKPVQFPYTYLAVDTIDKLEDIVDAEQTALFKAKTKDTKEPFTGTSVTELAYGAGYGMIREGVKDKIDALSKVCKHLILISHVKDKYLESKNGFDVTEKDLSLAGKLGGIVAAKADAIGYMYRNPTDQLMVSFKSSGNTVRGARFKHLAGKMFPFSWDSIFVPENLSAPDALTP